MGILIFIVGFILGAVTAGLIVAVGLLTKCDEGGDWWDE